MHDYYLYEIKNLSYVNNVYDKIFIIYLLYICIHNTFLKIKEEEGTISSIANIRNEQWIGFDDGHIMDLEYDPVFMRII